MPTGDPRLDALYEIAEMLKLPASNDPPHVAVVRGVREFLNLANIPVGLCEDGVTPKRFEHADTDPGVAYELGRYDERKAVVKHLRDSRPVESLRGPARMVDEIVCSAGKGLADYFERGGHI